MGLPEHLPEECALVADLRTRGEPARLGHLEGLAFLDPVSASFLRAASQAGARLLVPLMASRELYAFLVVGPKLTEEELTAQDLQLLRTVANQGAVGFENARFLREHTRQLELEKELAIARQVQFSLIPEEISAPPPWRVAARCIPAYQVGGDFYDVLPATPNPCQALVVGDVAGKSVAGAMLMVAAREALRASALSAKGGEELLRQVNAHLYRRKGRMILALTYLLLCPGGTLRYFLAGQPPLLLRRRTGAVEELPMPAARLPLGALAEAQWEEKSLQLQPGELVVVYSDGVLDAQKDTGESFGESLLKTAVAQAPGDPERAVEHIVRAVQSFTGDKQAFDDVTVMVLAWEGEA
jgi:serine phosphatase RsbU (regulator of sigma subunit)